MRSHIQPSFDADGTDHDVLEEQRITEYDVFVSMTGIDEENLILSAYAKQQGCTKDYYEDEPSSTS